MTASGDSLGRDLLAGKPAALARAISLVENASPLAADILRGIQPHLGKAVTVGVTGPPGAGKSTLVSALVGELRRRDLSVGVVAVDPSSPLSGGAILGDRIRMADHSEDPGVFIRSLASRGHLGGLSPMAARVVDLMDAAGKDVVLIETVGAGQSEVEIAEVADTKIVVAAPGLGDDIQAIKAGILEIADILVVNKCDQPHARRTIAQLSAMLHLSTHEAAGDIWPVPVLGTVAATGEGVDTLAETLLAHAARPEVRARRADPLTRVRRLLAEAAAQAVGRAILDGTDNVTLAAILARVQAGEATWPEAVAEALAVLARPA